MFGLQVVVERLGEVVADLDPAGLDGPGALGVFDLLDRVERLAAAGKALVAPRVDASGVWRRSGARDAAGFLAERSGCGRGRVGDALAVGAALGSMPAVEEGLRAGLLGVEAAADIAAALGDRPELEAELVELAQRVGRRQLRDRCVEIQAHGEGAQRQHQRARAERFVSSSVGRDGIWRLSARLAVIDGAGVDRVLDHFQTQVFEQARRRGEREPYGALRADALVAMADAAFGVQPAREHEAAATDPESPAGPQSRPRRGPGVSSMRHMVVITVPHTTFLTGEAPPGESCQVPGVGPVPWSVVRRLLVEGDPIVKAVVTRGRDITAVATLTRSIRQDLRLAVLGANNLACAVPGCANTRFLELDHEHEFHRGGPTSYDNLRPLCSYHHRQRSRHGYELTGPIGQRRWIAPDGTILAAEQAATPT